MKHSCFIRKIDELGRIVLPIEIRNILEIKEKDSLEIFLMDDGVFLRKYQDFCIFCNSNKDLNSFNNKHICISCLKKLKGGDSNE